jgi:acyl carrier protein
MNEPFNEKTLLDFIDQTYFLELPAAEVMHQNLIQLGLDSLKILSLSLEIERKFKKKINLETLQSSTTLRNIIDDLIDC